MAHWLDPHPSPNRRLTLSLSHPGTAEPYEPGMGRQVLPLVCELLLHSTLHPHTWESSIHNSPWVWESWLHTSPEKNGPRGLYWQTHLTPRHTSRTWSWHIPPSTQPMTCWSVWRSWSWGTIAIGPIGLLWLLAKAGHQRMLVRVHYWSCPKARSLEPDQQLITQRTFASKAAWTKSILHDSQQLPVAPRWKERQWRGGKDGRAKCFLF